MYFALKFKNYYLLAGQYQTQKPSTAHPIPGLKLVELPRGRCPRVDTLTTLQVSKRSAWNNFDCPYGWTQRRQLARRIDPQNIFIDEVDEGSTGNDISNDCDNTSSRWLEG